MVAAGAAVAAGATACNVQPGAAAFVGDDRITQAQVNDVFQSIVDAPAYTNVRQSDYANIRTSVAGALIMRDLTKRVAADQHIEIPPADYATMAKQTKLPQSNRYVRLEAENQAAINTLRNEAWDTPPSDSDVRAIYDTLAAQGFTMPYQQAGPQIKKAPKVGQTAALRGTFEGAIKKYGVDVNPRYGELKYPLDAVHVGPLSGYLTVDLGEGSPKVVDVVSTGSVQS